MTMRDFSGTYDRNRYDFYFSIHRTDLVPSLSLKLAFLCLLVGINKKEKSPLNV